MTSSTPFPATHLQGVGKSPQKLSSIILKVLIRFGCSIVHISWNKSGVFSLGGDENDLPLLSIRSINDLPCFCRLCLEYFQHFFQLPLSFQSSPLKLCWEAHILQYLPSIPIKQSQRAPIRWARRTWNWAISPHPSVGLGLSQKLTYKNGDMCRSTILWIQGASWVLQKYWRSVAPKRRFVTLSCQIFVSKGVKPNYVSFNTAHQTIAKRPSFDNW